MLNAPRPDTKAHPHWRHGLRETVLSTASDGSLHFSVIGGSDNGEFAQVGVTFSLLRLVNEPAFLLSFINNPIFYGKSGFRRFFNAFLFAFV
jgi:hypothetical protein